jgi:hypothetical protein
MDGSNFLFIVIAIYIALSGVFGMVDNDNQTTTRGAVASVFVYSIAYTVFLHAEI